MKTSSSKSRKQPHVQAAQGQVVDVAPSTLGEQLKRARLARKLDVPDVAHQLHLKPSVIRALEADDYKSLPGTTFTKGYIRNYARHLGLPSDAMAKLFELQTGSVNAMDETHPLPERVVRRPGQVGWRSATVALVILALGAVMAWHWSQGAKETGSLPPMAIPEQLVDEQIDTVVVEQQDVEREPPVRSVSYTAVAGPAENPRLARQAEDVPSDAAQPVAPGYDLQSAEQAEPVVSTIESPAVAESDARQAEPIAAASPQAVASAIEQREHFAQQVESAKQAVLAMEFSDKCWVEVRDRSRVVNIQELKREGGSLVVQGVPPFDIKFGNGDAVQMTYNGEPVSLTGGQRRGRVIVMTLGEQE